MDKEKIAITLDRDSLTELDRLVGERVFSSRSQAIQEAVREKLARLKHKRLAAECAKLEPSEEQTMAEEGLAEDINEWPQY